MGNRIFLKRIEKSFEPGGKGEKGEKNIYRHIYTVGLDTYFTKSSARFGMSC
jgi:hypothetical protein